MKKASAVNVYLAGPLFSRGEIKSRLDDEAQLKEIKSDKIKFKIFNPIRFNQVIKNNAIDIEKNRCVFFDKDIKEMARAQICIADIDNFDSGTILELGYFLGWKKKNKKLKVYVIYSNWKGAKTLNKFVEGAILRESNGMFKDIGSVIKQIKKDFKIEEEFENE